MCVATLHLAYTLRYYQRCFALPPQVAHKFNKLANAPGATSRKLLVIFALLVFLHTLHEVFVASELGDDIKAVVGYLHGDKEASKFSQLLASERDRDKMAGRFFLSELEL